MTKQDKTDSERSKDKMDFKKVLSDLAVERFGSPLISSFILAWCAFNIKFILILFSFYDIDNKIAKIDEYQPLIEWLWPAVFAIGFTFGTRLLDIPVTFVLEWLNRKKAKIILKSLALTPFDYKDQVIYFEYFKSELDKENAHAKQRWLEASKVKSRHKKIVEELQKTLVTKSFFIC